MAVYFESIGRGKEQAIKDALRWLGVSLSRKEAKKAVSKFKRTHHASQYKAQAGFAYATYSGSTMPLPTTMAHDRKRRRSSI